MRLKLSLRIQEFLGEWTLEDSPQIVKDPQSNRSIYIRLSVVVI